MNYYQKSFCAIEKCFCNIEKSMHLPDSTSLSKEVGNNSMQVSDEILLVTKADVEW